MNEIRCEAINVTKFNIEIVTRCETMVDKNCNVTFIDVPTQKCSPTERQRFDIFYEIFYNFKGFNRGNDFFLLFSFTLIFKKPSIFCYSAFCSQWKGNRKHKENHIEWNFQSLAPQSKPLGPTLPMIVYYNNGRWQGGSQCDNMSCLDQETRASHF